MKPGSQRSKPEETSSQTDVGGLTGVLAKLRRNLPLYAEACLIIRDKQSRFIPLRFNRAQRIVHEKISRQLKETGRVRAVILKARQEGISTYVAARFFRKIHLWRGVYAMIVADSLKRAGELWKIYDRFRQHLPPEIMPVKKATQAEAKIVFGHDSELTVRPSTDTEAGRASTLHCLHASELAYWGPGLRETWVSLMQAIPPDGGEVIVESTAKGAGGLFHELWELAEEGKAGWIPIFLPWWIHEEYDAKPGWDPALEEQIRKEPDDFEVAALYEGIPYEGEIHTLPISRLVWRRLYIAERFRTDPFHPAKDAVRGFQQEFPATAEEAFLVSGACFFDEDQLRRMTRETQPPVVRGRLVEKRGPNREHIIWVEENVRGAVRVWEHPHPKLHYVIGADTATGELKGPKQEALDFLGAETEMGGRDYSSAIVLRLPYWSRDPETGESVFHPLKLVAEVHGHLVPEIFAHQINLLGHMYACGTDPDRRPALLAVENSHSSGNTVLRLLREHYKYPRLYWARDPAVKRTREVRDRVGWRTDETTRMPMLDELGQVVREGRIELPSKDTVREMVTFILHPNGKPAAEEGCHDDRVIALAIALQMLREHYHFTSSDRRSMWEPEETPTGM